MALPRSRRLPPTRVGLAPLGIAFAHRLVFVAVLGNIVPGCRTVTDLWQDCDIALVGGPITLSNTAVGTSLYTNNGPIARIHGHKCVVRSPLFPQSAPPPISARAQTRGRPLGWLSSGHKGRTATVRMNAARRCTRRLFAFQESPRAWARRLAGSGHRSGRHGPRWPRRAARTAPFLPGRPRERGQRRRGRAPPAVRAQTFTPKPGRKGVGARSRQGQSAAD
jgi:hypothetical protein